MPSTKTLTSETISEKQNIGIQFPPSQILVQNMLSEYSKNNLAGLSMAMAMLIFCGKPTQQSPGHEVYAHMFGEFCPLEQG
jgi:hypothetical protein